MFIETVHFHNSIFEIEHDVTIKKISESDFLFIIDNISEDFNAFASGDSLFIPLQWWPNFDGTRGSFQGKAKIENDSLFLSYGAGGSFGVVDCECKGEKTSSISNL